MNIHLGSNWSRFYDDCDKRKINAKKMVCAEPKKPETFQERVLLPNTEEDFWKVERDVVSQPDKWHKLGYVRNPWAVFMLSLDFNEYEQPELYLHYLNAHPIGLLPLPDELLKYHNRLNEVFF